MATLLELKQHLMSGGKVRRADWENPSWYLRKCVYNDVSFINPHNETDFIDFQDAVADDWEIYEDYPYIGCLCKFWTGFPDNPTIGILSKIYPNADRKFENQRGFVFTNCKPMKPEEVKFYKGE